MDYTPPIEPPAIVRNIKEFGIETNIFGKSHHFDDGSWNENNYGGGFNVTYTDNKIIQVVNYNGIYKDSYNKEARYSLFGIRLIVGDKKSFHGSFGYGMGYFCGSGFKNIGVLPEVLIGYDRISIGITGSLEKPYMIGGFINIRLFEF